MKTPAKRSVDPATIDMLSHTEGTGPPNAWDRHDAMQPQCGFGELGLCCRNCSMGPCRVDLFGEGATLGVCGADADIIAARNLIRMIAAGASSHSDHGRDVVKTLLTTAQESSASPFNQKC